MNGHIQDFADKLNRKEENKNKKTKKKLKWTQQQLRNILQNDPRDS